MEALRTAFGISAEAAGLPGYDIDVWFGVLAPAGTPPEIVNQLSRAVADALAKPEVVESYKRLEYQVGASTPEEFLALSSPVPPIDEQRDIVAECFASRRRTNKLVSRLERQIELLREHRQALITAAVTGELEVPGVAA